MAALRMHRVGKYVIPGFLIVYVLIAGTNLLFGFRAGEIFPFFAWTLFSHTPERIKLQPAHPAAYDRRRPGDRRALRAARRKRR